MCLDDVLTAYVKCALWSSTDDDGEPLDGLYTVDDIAPEALADMRTDVADFVSSNAADLDGIDDGQIGRDFWLTRCGHGAGFWDRGLGDVGDRLTASAKPYGESDLYIGDDGRVYVA
jgi:hypothetical protein